MLANAAGKDEEIDAAQERGVRADDLRTAVVNAWMARLAAGSLASVA